MRKNVKSFGIIAVIAIIGLCFIGCNQPTVPDPEPENRALSMNRFEVQPTELAGEHKIIYSYDFEGYGFYYIHLGQLRNIPVFFQDAQLFNTAEMTYQLETTHTEESVFRDVIVRSSDRALTVVNENTRSTTDTTNLTTEVNNKLGLSVEAGVQMKILSAKKTAQWEAEFKVKAENTWQRNVTERISNTVEERTSLSDTIEHATTITMSQRQTITWPLSRINGDPNGWYRYTLFGASDVYVYVIKDPDGDIVYFELKEHAIPGLYGWGMDFCADMRFARTDFTTFDFDISLLENLPPAGMATVTFNKNHDDPECENPEEETRMVNLNASVGSQMPLAPERYRHTFARWNTQADGSGTNFLQNTPVIESITVYAIWTSLTTYRLTVNANPLAGGNVTPTIPPSVPEGDSFPITATANPGYSFVDWTVASGDAEINNPTSNNTTVKMNSNATVRANFRGNLRLTVEQNIAAGGTTSSSSDSNIAPGFSIQIRATPANGYSFAGWTVVSGTATFTDRGSPNTDVILTTDTTIRANFELRNFQLNVQRYPADVRDLSVTPGSGMQPAATDIPIRANTISGWRFINWTVISGQAVIANVNSATTTVRLLTSDATVRANYLPTSRTDYRGDVGRITLQNRAAFNIRFDIEVLQDNGTWRVVTVNPSFATGLNRTFTTHTDIPDGSFIFVRSQATGGTARPADQTFMFRSGNQRHATYRHTGNLLTGHTLHFDGVQ